jgi:hypothetical protein
MDAAAMVTWVGERYAAVPPLAAAGRRGFVGSQCVRAE